MVISTPVPFRCALMLVSLALSGGIWKKSSSDNSEVHVNRDTHQLEQKDLDDLGGYSTAVSVTGLGGPSELGGSGQAAYHEVVGLLNENARNEETPTVSAELAGSAELNGSAQAHNNIAVELPNNNGRNEEAPEATVIELSGSSRIYHDANALLNNNVNGAVASLEEEGRRLGWSADELRRKKVNLVAMMSDKARYCFWVAPQRRYEGDLEPRDLTLLYDANDERSYIQQLESRNDGSYNRIKGHSWEEADIYYGYDGTILGLELNVNGGYDNRANGGETWHRYFN